MFVMTRIGDRDRETTRSPSTRMSDRVQREYPFAIGKNMHFSGRKTAIVAKTAVATPPRMKNRRPGFCRFPFPEICQNFFPWIATRQKGGECPPEMEHVWNREENTGGFYRLTTYEIWWRWRDSNPRPSDYDSPALPTELHRLD